MAKKATPQEFLERVQKDYGDFDPPTARRPGPRAQGRPRRAAGRRASRAGWPTCTCCRRSSFYAAFLLFPLVRSVQLSLFAGTG